MHIKQHYKFKIGSSLPALGFNSKLVYQFIVDCYYKNLSINCTKQDIYCITIKAVKYLNYIVMHPNSGFAYDFLGLHKMTLSSM